MHYRGVWVCPWAKCKMNKWFGVFHRISMSSISRLELLSWREKCLKPLHFLNSWWLSKGAKNLETILSISKHLLKKRLRNRYIPAQNSAIWFLKWSFVCHKHLCIVHLLYKQPEIKVCILIDPVSYGILNN